MVTRINSCALSGMEGSLVVVEVDVTNGLPSYETVGLPDKAVVESKERVRAAIRNTGYIYPPRRVTVNLAPADMRKIGTVYDLPIALGLMVSAGLLDLALLKPVLSESMFVGEMALNGELRPIQGVLSMALEAKNQGFKRLFCPEENADEAACIEGIDVFAVPSLATLCAHLNGTEKLKSHMISKWEPEISQKDDFSLIRGQYAAKRAAEVAAAGGHNILLIGPPGGGKTMLARAMQGILPDLSFDEALEITRIHSAAGRLSQKGLIRHRPFISPHHTASAPAITGGGLYAKPGDISMAHLGVLFMDEFPEFRRDVLEALRQPIEDGKITVSRVHSKATFPARFMLIGAMNPCPCGYYGARNRQCNCSKSRIERYLSRLSGPLIDRIDIFIPMEELHYKDFHASGKNLAESSDAIRKRVNACRDIQRIRFSEMDISCNAHMSQAEIEKFCLLDESARGLYKKEFMRLKLNGRANARILRLARTIADLENCELISSAHISEAIQYRIMDRFWK